MKYEVVEATGAWIVRHAGLEVARFDGQAAALQDVARRLGETPQARSDGPAKLSLKYRAREA